MVKVLRMLLCLVVAAPFATLLLGSALADAAFVVRSCGEGGADRSWASVSSGGAARLITFERCPAARPEPYPTEGSLEQGIGTFDELRPEGGALVPADNRFAEQRFSAPAGTAITSAILHRDLGNRDVYWHPYGSVDGTELASESCVKASGEAFCRISGIRSLQSLRARTLSYGISCTNSWGGCNTGATLHMAWSLVLSATVTLDDLEPPTVSAPSGDLTDGSWHRGAGTVRFVAEDNTGVRVRRLVEGAVVRAARTAPGASAGGCGDLNAGEAYTYLQPCAGDRGLNGEQAISVTDVCPWGDGEHRVHAAAVDTGGKEARDSAAVTVKVDCTAPQVTVAATQEGAVPAGTVLEPVVAATDARSGVQQREVEVRVDGAAWQASTSPIAVAPGSTYTFRARATDVAGNRSEWVVAPSSTYGLTPVAPQQPQHPDQRPAATPAAPKTPTTPTQDEASPPQTPTLTFNEAAWPAPPVPALAAAPTRALVTVRITTIRRSRDRRAITVKGTVAGRRSGVLRLTARAGRQRTTKRVTFARGRFATKLSFRHRTTRRPTVTATIEDR